MPSERPRMLFQWNRQACFECSPSSTRRSTTISICVLFVFVQLDFFAEIIDYSVNAHADISVLFRAFEFLDELTLFTACNRCHDLNSGALGQLACTLSTISSTVCRRYLPAADGTVWNTYAGIEQAQIIIYFSHRSDGRTRVL